MRSPSSGGVDLRLLEVVVVSEVVSRLRLFFLPIALKADDGVLFRLILLNREEKI